MHFLLLVLTKHSVPMKTTFFLSLLALLPVTGRSQPPEPFVSENGLYGFAKDQRPVIAATFQYATHFRERRALVKQNDHWGFIDSTGAWVVQPVYDAAQPFTDGKSYVFLAGKEGIIDPDGKYLLEPVYDSFVEEYYGTKVMKGTKKGCISDNWEQPVSVAYMDFDFIGGYLSAKKAEGNYDLYRNGNRLLAGMSRKVDYGDLQTEIGQVIVTVNGKSGIINSSGEWIVQPLYSKIAAVNLAENASEGWQSPTGCLYVLDATDYQLFGNEPASDEMLGPKRFFLARTNGRLIDPEPFEATDAVEHTDGSGRHLELLKNGRIAYLLPDFKVQMTPYSSITPFFSWKFCDDGERIHILNDRDREIAVFDAVEFPEVSYEMYDENGDPLGYYSDPQYLPYVWAKKRVGDTFEYAPYSLENAELMDTWSPVKKAVNSFYPVNGPTFYTLFNPETDLVSYYYPGMERPSLQDYTLIDLKNDRYLVANRANSPDQFLLAIDRLKGPELLVQAPVVGLSTEFFTMTWSPEYPPDGENEAEVVYLFERPFMYYKAGNGRFGLVTDEDRVLPPLYDTITQNDSLIYMVNVSIDGKWGSVDIRNGKTIAPAYPQPLVFRADENSGLTYVKAESYYLNENGRKIYSLGTGEEIIFKEKGKYGLKVYSDFSGETEEWVPVIPSVYKELELTPYYGRYIARNDEGKYGVLNQYSDTIVPFLYSSIRLRNELMDGEEPVFATTIGKKTGLLQLYTGKQIPALYDSYSLCFNGNAAAIGILVKSGGKVGLYSLEMQELLPCTYDALYVVNNQSELSTDYSSGELRALKNGKWYVLAFSGPQELTEWKLLRQQPFDLTIGNLGYVKTTTGYDCYNATYGDPLQKGLSEQEMLANTDNGTSYRMILRDGKIGVLNQKQKVILKPTLTSVLWKDNHTLLSVENGEPTYFDLRTNEHRKQQW